MEARVVTRCCIENALWVARLVKEGDSFVRDMLGDDARHRIGRAQRLLKGSELGDETSEKLRSRLKEIAKQYQNPKQLTPSGVADSAVAGQVYILYQKLSADAAHPSLDALSRYVLPPTESEPEGIDVEPAVDDAEITETLEYLSVAVLGVCFGVNDLLGGTPGASALNGLAARHVELSNRTHAAGDAS
jgi:hypothetical protein